MYDQSFETWTYYNFRFKIDLAVAEGSHSTAAEITKQINDKERVAAALENPNLRKTIEECIRERES